MRPQPLVFLSPHCQPISALPRKCVSVYDCGKELCESGDNEDTTCLFGFLKTLKKLLKAGVDVNKVKVLESAAQCGHEECVDALIEAGADVNAKTCPLALDDSIEAGANVNAKTCPLALAIKSENRRCVELLVKAEADVNSKCETSESFKTNVLREAVKSGNEEIVQLLLDARADVNFKIIGAISPLCEAALTGRCNILEFLIKAGADVKEDQSSALICTLRCTDETQPRSSFTTCVDLLIKAGADVNYGEKEWWKQTPIFIAVRSGFNEGLDLLIKAGADVNRLDNGLSPLMLAAALGFYKCVELLLAAGADVNQVNNTGETAHVCISHRYRDYNYEPKTPLQHKVLQEVLPKINFTECGKILLRAGAKVNPKLWNNRPLEYCIQDFKVQRESFLLLYAAGETLEDNTTTSDPDNRNPKIPDDLMLEDPRLDLMHMCRQAIRKRLLDLDPHEHLFGRIPKLGLPKLLTRYLLYNFSLE